MSPTTLLLTSDGFTIETGLPDGTVSGYIGRLSSDYDEFYRLIDERVLDKAIELAGKRLGITGEEIRERLKVGPVTWDESEGSATIREHARS